MFSVNAREKFQLEKTKESFTKWYDQILPIADVVDKRYPVKGMPILKPYGFFMHDQIMKLLEDEWAAQQIYKAQFPLLIPEAYLKKEEDHLEGFKAEVFWARGGAGYDETQVGEEKDEYCALRPTSETAMYATFKEWIRSHVDLPLKIHQTCCVYRYETSSTLPLIRAREIHWNEAHTVHATEVEALQNLENAWTSYLKIIEEDLCFTGLRLRRPIWDSFPGGVHTDVMDTVMPSGKVLQTVGAHYLGQKFAKVFEIQFTGESGENETPYMTCYGVSTRLLAAALSLHGDEFGLVLPTKIAMIQIVVVPVMFKKGAESVMQACRDWVAECRRALPGVRVHLDDSKKQPGNKYYFWEMKGVPIRVEIGPKDVEKNQICLVGRTTGKAGKKFVPMSDWISVMQALNDHDGYLRKQAFDFHQANVHSANSLEELGTLIEEGGLVRIPYHTVEVEGKEGDEKIHDLCGGEIRGFVPDEKVENGIKCLVTGKEATCYAYVARAY